MKINNYKRLLIRDKKLAVHPTRSLKPEKTETSGGVSNNKEEGRTTEANKRGVSNAERKSIGTTSLITGNGALLGLA
ncbi:hypothetical protein Pmani_025075 [Petrolisthes manimaculis]|uniref:Uncharacterized protein n=1 Tax=Petrolisthes manimaculis TaxID=1843537 RepID=A0AAE1TYP7_9EUCA|nr:hypothetical protein Pmani_025075 [Petrolisthes manimaculis]